MPEVNHSGVVLSNSTQNPVLTVYENKPWKYVPANYKAEPEEKFLSVLAHKRKPSVKIREIVCKRGGYGAQVVLYFCNYKQWNLLAVSFLP